MTALIADVALAGGLAVHVELLTRLRTADGPAPSRWFGYARDATNLAAALMFWGAYLLVGFAPAVAFLAAAMTTLATYLLDWAVARALGVRRTRLALALLLAGWVAVMALAPRPVERTLQKMIEAAQPVH